MPKINFFFNERKCTIETKNGVDPEQNGCMGTVKQYLRSNNNAKLIYLVHGFKGFADKPWLIALKDGLLKRYQGSVVGIVGWKEAASLLKGAKGGFRGGYEIAAISTWFIGNILAYANNEIEVKSADSKTYCIGHSLGAHLCGFFSKMRKKLNPKFPLQKILGMDPAGPIFKNPRHHFSLKLNSLDARVVEVWHTNTASLGYKNAGLGSIEFYINGGANQPQCNQKVWNMGKCSHNLAYSLIAFLTQHNVEWTLRCYAKWECLNGYDKGLDKIKKEKGPLSPGERELRRIGCTEENRDRYVNLGELGITSDKPTSTGSVYWVEVSKTSFTCKVDVPKL
jgi:hypothetical protein